MYDKRLLKIISIPKKVISIGNISWGGTGKTSLVMYLHNRLSDNFKVCSVTKGYARDEFYLVKERFSDTFDSRDRVALIRRLASKYDVFILDDGFQYRKLKRNLDIVLLKKVELQRRAFMIPASVFREPLKSLRRSDIVVVTYCQPQEFSWVRDRLLKIKKDLKVFCADYIFSGLLDKNQQEVSLDYFKNRSVGILTGIGYPKGFLDKVLELGFNPEKILIYPDHYELNEGTLKKVEAIFLAKGIEDILITYKDFYHISLNKTKLNYFIFCVELKIYREEQFLETIKERLSI